MAFNLYIQNDTIPYNPATLRGAWDATATPATGKLGLSPAGAAATVTKSETSATNNFDVLWGKWVSDGLIQNITIDGTVTWVLGVNESNADANAFIHVHMFVTQGDSDNVRGTLLTDSIGATEFSTTAAGRSEGAKTLSSVAAQTGDRIVVEIGIQFQNTHTTARNTALRYGNTGTVDLGIADTNVTTRPGYFQFSKDGLLTALASTLTDNFDDNSLDGAKWTSSADAGVTLAEASQQLQITGALTAGSATLISVNRYSLISSSFTTKLVDGGNQLVDPTYLDICYAFKEATQSYAVWWGVSGGLLLANYRLDFADTTLRGDVSFDVAVHVYFRIRESGGTVYWDYSTNGYIWTNYTSVAVSSLFPLGALLLGLQAGHYAVSGTATVFKFDDVNIVPASTFIPRTILI